MGTHSPNIVANCMISSRIYNPDADYVVYGNRRITWGEMVPRIFKLAQALVKLGVKRNDKIAFMFHNTPEFIEVNNAIQVAGAIPTPMNYRYVASEVEFQGKHSDSRVLIYDSIWSEAVEAAAPNIPNIEHFVCRGKSGLPDAVEYEEFCNSGEDRDPAVANDLKDVAVMIYTGGTTGFPKGVMLTYLAHVEMFANMASSFITRALATDMPKERQKLMLETLPLPGKKLLGPLYRSKMFKKFAGRESTKDVFYKLLYKRFTDPDEAKKGYKNLSKAMYPSMPFFHDASYSNLFMGELIGYMCYVLPESASFDPPAILELVQREEVTTMSNVPTGWKKLISHPDFDKYNTDSIRLITTGGGSCAIDLKRKIMEKFPNATILDVFGQTEMTPIVSFRLDVDSEKLTERSVGKSIVEAKIVDEGGKVLPQGEIGEILYRSSTVMKGYYKDEKKTKEVMDDGWFRSGDLGYFDENGEIRTVDRKKECINTGGEKVYPLEVEEILQTFSGIDYACVIGVPDEEWGHSVRAVIQLVKGSKMEEKEIKEFCRGKMAAYKIPRSVVFTDELPFSPAGKLLRQKVRELFA